MLNFAIYSSPVGYLKIGYEDNQLTLLQKIDVIEKENFPTKFSEEVFKQIIEYFNGERKIFTFRCKLIGTDFQKRVWNEIFKIPYGEVRSYKEIAESIGNDKAVRAVGKAISKNPILIVYPCHRVVGANGKLVGYAGGLDMKEYLLRIEEKNYNN